MPDSNALPEAKNGLQTVTQGGWLLFRQDSIQDCLPFLLLSRRDGPIACKLLKTRSEIALIPIYCGYEASVELFFLGSSLILRNC